MTVLGGTNTMNIKTGKIIMLFVTYTVHRLMLCKNVLKRSFICSCQIQIVVCSLILVLYMHEHFANWFFLCFTCCFLIPHFLLIRLETVLSTLEDAVNDAPKAPEFLGKLFAKFITENVTSLKEIGRLVFEGGEVPGMLIEAGLGGDVIGCTLEYIKVEKGDSFLKEIRAGSNLRLEDFKPPHPVRSKKLDPFL
jgi:hypothetical protein